MERWQRFTIAILAVVVGGFGLFTLGFALGQDDATREPGAATSSQVDAARLIQEAFDEIMSLSVEAPEASDIARAAIKAMIRSLRQAEDPYALFYSPKGYRDFQEFATGRFSGIGVWLKPKDGELEIVSVLPGTPADGSGLEPGDRIETVDGKDVDTERIDVAVAAIKGPEGSKVRLVVRRDGRELRFTIERAEIDLPNLRAEMTDEGLGHLRLFGFGRRAGDQLRDEVEALLDDGAKGMILDLRDNGGGLFAEAVNVASVFIEDGEIVTYRDGSRDDVVYEAEGDAFADVPLVVLVNEGTASASEIVAGALQSRGRGIVIGTRTFGKGTVQEVVPLSDASALKVTTAAYLTPGGHDIDGRGIRPDIKVADGPRKQFRRAVMVLQGLVASIRGAAG